ncbi:hypothetical protein TELCIR_00343 [Teladorsagia circumcincta]|uniref:Uncharacterized protein n=1 Tax=Teladorsagia circumcincta TaxID=45464 RepID=A0A2G9V507_TELCI|nr:hypothetical protein TELCIR_00343 [Teladorsagia circumcincta]
MGSSMTKTSPSAGYDYRRRGTQEVRENFSKEYSEYWKRPSIERTSNFSTERNSYASIATDNASSKRNSTQYSKVGSSFR